MKKTITAMLTLAFLSVGTPYAAFGQVIEEVVVTAQKRSESIQDVSVAVTAVSGDELLNLGITDAFSLDKLAPGLQLGLSGNDPRPALRGARTQQVEANDVAVSFYADGLYRPRHGQALAGFVDVDRVEVLRGPQGTLFGRNSFGGLIHVISNKPDFNENDYGFALTLGDYERVRAEGFANFALSDTLAVRIAGVSETRDPFVENITIGDSGGLKDADTGYLRGQLAFAPNDLFDLNVRIELWEDDSLGNGSFGYYAEGVPVNLETGLTNGVSGVMRQRIGRSNECAGTCGRALAGFDDKDTPGLDTSAPVLGDPYKIQDDVEPVRDLEELTIGLDATYSFAFADLKVTVADMEYDEFRWADCDFSAYSGTACGNLITSDTSQQEFQLTSTGDGPLEWVAGLFFLQEDLSNAFLWLDFASGVDNVPVVPADRNAFASWANQIQVETSSQAVYGQATYAMQDNLRFIAGARYTDDEREWKIYGQNPDNPRQLDFSILEVDDGEGSWDRFTWKLGAEYDIGTDSMLYFTVSTGFLAGNQQGAFNGTEFYDEQTVIAYELGSKNLLQDGTLRVNASLYANMYEDLLATRFVDTGVTTLAFTDNAGEIESVGLELEIDWLPSEALMLGARISLQDASYGDFVLPNVYQEGGETINGNDNLFQLDGLQVQHSPDYTITLIGSYSFDLGANGRIEPGITLFASDEYRADDSPWFYGNQDAYTKTDLSLTWVSSDEDWNIRAFVNNLEDEAVLMKATRFGGDLAFTDWGAPRTYGVTVRHRY